MDNRTYPSVALDRESFAPFVGILFAALGGALSLAFAIMSLSGVGSGGEGEHIYSAGRDALYVAAGGLLVVGAVYSAIAIVLARLRPRLNAMLLPVAAPAAVAFLLAMIAGIANNGQYTTTVEIAYFALSVLSCALVVLRLRGVVTFKKAVIALAAIAALSVFCVFVPVITRDVSVADATYDYMPYVCVFLSFPLIALGLREVPDHD